jgi:hypothetical protein
MSLLQINLLIFSKSRELTECSQSTLELDTGGRKFTGHELLEFIVERFPK